MPTQAEASNSAAPSVAKPQAMALLSMLTTKLGLSDVQKSKMESVISKLDMENITSPKAQVKSLLSKSLPELSGFLKPNQLDTLKGLAESAKKGKK